MLRVVVLGVVLDVVLGVVPGTSAAGVGCWMLGACLVLDRALQ